jgi:hypothetical protein
VNITLTSYLTKLGLSVVSMIGSRWKATRHTTNTNFADEVKPNCQRCEKAGFVCLGYERERLWRISSTAPDPKPVPPRPGSRKKVAVVLRTSNSELTMQPPSPPPELSLVAFEDDFCFTVMFENHVWRSSAGPWLQPAINGEFGDLALTAVHALSKANFGKLFHLSGIEREGVVLHGRCLKLLADRLATVNHESQELIVPILVLLMHAVSSAAPNFSHISKSGLELIHNRLLNQTGLGLSPISRGSQDYYTFVGRKPSSNNRS